MNESITVDGQTVATSKAMDFSDIEASNIAMLDGKSFSASCSYGCGQIFTFKFSSTEPSSAALDSMVVSAPGINVVVNISGKTSGAELVDEVYSQVSTLNSAIITAASFITPTRTLFTKPASSTYIGQAMIAQANGLNEAVRTLLE